MVQCSSGLHIVHIAAEMAPVAKVILVTFIQFFIKCV